MGTLGKAFGSFGAYVAGDKHLIEFLLNSARSFIFSTALPPAICAASLAALDIVEQEPERRKKLWLNRDRFVQGLKTLGIDTSESETPIIPVMIGSSEKATQASLLLLESGVFASAIRPPTVAEGTSRIRTTVTAAHSFADIDAALAAFGALKQKGYAG